MTDGKIVWDHFDDEIFNEGVNMRLNPTIGQEVECVFIHMEGGGRGLVYIICHILPLWGMVVSFIIELKGQHHLFRMSHNHSSGLSG